MEPRQQSKKKTWAEVKARVAKTKTDQVKRARIDSVAGKYVEGS